MDDSFPMIDQIDHEILMHRDAHFSGNFNVMLAYYEKEGRGLHPEFTLKRLEELAHLENHLGYDLSERILFDEEKEQINQAKLRYALLRDIYNKAKASDIPCLIADLILAEEDEAQKEMDVLVNLKEKAVPALISLLSLEDYYNPLFPGYGEAPALAARCLGRIADPRAIQPLFNALGKQDFFTEDVINEALAAIGEPAKQFLLERLTKLPLTKENESAIIALLSFNLDPEIANAALDLLENPAVATRPTFAAYLIMACLPLKKDDDRARFKNLKERFQKHADLVQEIDIVMMTWKPHGRK